MSRAAQALARLNTVLDELLEAQQFTSAATSIKQLPKAFTQLDREGVWKKGQSVLDIGAGRYDLGKRLLAKRGVQCHCFDPYNRDEDENRKAMSSGPYDVVLLNNVLNVIREPEEREKAVALAKKQLKPEGTLIVQAYRGDGSGKGRRTGPDQYQLNRELTYYEPLLKKFFPDVESRAGLLRARLTGMVANS